MTNPRATLSQSEVRLLLLASRPVWTDEQRSLASVLAPEVKQWSAFTDTALQKYSLPMVYGHLGSLSNQSVPDDVLATMHDMSIQVVLEMLRRKAAFDWFHANCVLPSHVEYAYFKGPALAARFYPDPMQRFYRDVDILVPRSARKPLLRFLQNKGCKILHFSGSDSAFLELDSNSALSEYLFVTPVPHLVTPQGLVVELHSEIDQHTSLFDTAELLASAFEMPMQQLPVRVLRDPEHIVFTFYHHTRHLWSKLNWLADVDAICNHPHFDSAAVLDCARRMKIDSTAFAVFKFHQLAAAGHHPSTLERQSPGRDLLQACVDNLPGDLALEQSLRSGQRLNVIKFDWQPRPVSVCRYAWLRLRKLRPTYEDMHVFQHGRVLRYLAAASIRMARGLKSVLGIGRPG